MSVTLSPFLEKLPTRSARSEVGGGRSLFAKLRLAVVESLLPNGTAYDAPPSCKVQLIKRDVSTGHSGRPSEV